MNGRSRTVVGRTWSGGANVLLFDDGLQHINSQTRVLLKQAAGLRCLEVASGANELGQTLDDHLEEAFWKVLDVAGDIRDALEELEHIAIVEVDAVVFVDELRECVRGEFGQGCDVVHITKAPELGVENDELLIGLAALLFDVDEIARVLVVVRQSDGDPNAVEVVDHRVDAAVFDIVDGDSAGLTLLVIDISTNNHKRGPRGLD